MKASSGCALITLEDMSIGISGRVILKDINIELRAGEIVAVVGRSGCGKSTLVRHLAGLLEEPAHYRRPNAYKVRMAITFQEPTLLPWLSVEENIRLPGVLGGYPVDTNGLLDRMLLEGAGKLKPEQLSGGMQHRVALARALASQPSLLLLDEPYRALDEATRELLYEDLVRVTKEDNLGVLLVTHSLTEAWFVANRIHVLAGTPATITDTYETIRDNAFERHALEEIRQRLRADIVSAEIK